MNTATQLERASDLRTVSGVYGAPGLHWVGDGFRVAGYFNGIPKVTARLSPFLLLDYHPPYDYPPTKWPRGVGVHPHRGFETVSIAWEGSVAHHDSAGGGGVIGPGDVQWMTAGSGVLHKEYHEAGYAERGGTFHMAQLWVNLPREHKMSPPRYQALTAKEIGVVALPKGTVRVIAGTFGGVTGPAQTFTPIDLFDIRLEAGGKLPLSRPAHHNVSLLVMKGAVTINGAKAKLHDLVVLANDGERVLVEATADAQLLLLGGEPIDEPVVQHGPFVMNTREEIAQAFADLRDGKFGTLED